MGGSACTTVSNVGLSGSRPLFPHEYELSRVGIHTRWTARVDERPVSRLSSLPNPQEWWSALLDLVNRWPLLARFSTELARENGQTFWVLMGLNLCQACVPSCELRRASLAPELHADLSALLSRAVFLCSSDRDCEFTSFSEHMY